MPSGSNYRNNYMVEGSINLPWLNRRKHDAEIAEAKAQVSEQDAELAAMRNAAFGQIQEALVQVRAAKRLADLYQMLCSRKPKPLCARRSLPTKMTAPIFSICSIARSQSWTSTSPIFRHSPTSKPDLPTWNLRSERRSTETAADYSGGDAMNERTYKTGFCNFADVCVVLAGALAYVIWGGSCVQRRREHRPRRGQRTRRCAQPPASLLRLIRHLRHRSRRCNCRPNGCRPSA